MEHKSSNSTKHTSWSSEASTIKQTSFIEEINAYLKAQNRLKFHNQVFIPSPKKQLEMNFAKIESLANRMSRMAYDKQRFTIVKSKLVAN
ncbi:hypothetical protein BB558_001392 [Smittium angustum]|nr:hypothetical protein BB558_001392 [Smittium angustum]